MMIDYLLTDLYIRLMNNNTTLNFGLNEKNFLGEGNKVRFDVSLSDQKNSYNIGATDPYFLNRPLSISFDVYNEESENSLGDVKSSSSGVGVSLGLKSNSWYQQLKYNYYSLLCLKLLEGEKF